MENQDTKELKQIESDINFCNAGLKQLIESDHFTEDDVKALSVNTVLKLRRLQRRYDTLRAKNQQVVEAISVQAS